MSNITVVLSGKGGVGKSTVSIGIAAAFERKSKKVLLIDMDEGLRCLDLMLGISEGVVYDVTDIFNSVPVIDAVYPVPNHNGLFLMPAGLKYKNAIDSFGFSDFVMAVSEKFDEIIIDMPAGIDFRVIEKLKKDARVLVVCNPDKVSLRDGFYVFSALADMQFKKTRLVINKFVSSFVKKGVYDNIDDIIDKTGMRLIAILPEDRKLPVYQSKCVIRKSGKLVRAFSRLADRLDGESVPLPDIKKI